jgi:hypothetical protein
MYNVEEPVIYEMEKPENEPTYCFCGGISYGNMIQCDYANVKIKKFIFILLNPF